MNSLTEIVDNEHESEKCIIERLIAQARQAMDDFVLDLSALMLGFMVFDFLWILSGFYLFDIGEESGPQAFFKDLMPGEYQVLLCL